MVMMMITMDIVMDMLEVMTFFCADDGSEDFVKNCDVSIGCLIGDDGDNDKKIMVMAIMMTITLVMAMMRTITLVTAMMRTMNFGYDYDIINWCQL